MKIFAPGYYRNFRCIAGECRHSCCVGWRVEVDEACEARLNETALNERLHRHLGCDDDGKYIKMADDGRCPFLGECGLCDIITEVGEEYLARICDEHPRYYNYIGNRLEVGVGLSCEAAARLVLSSDDILPNVVVGGYFSDAVAPEYDSTEDRAWLLTLIVNEAIPYREVVATIEGKYGVSADMLSDEEWDAAFGSLEYLDEASRDMIKARRYIDEDAFDIYMRRFLGYLIYRHTGEVDSYLELCARVGFALLGVAALESMLAYTDAHSFEDVVECARIFSSEIEYSEDNVDLLIFEFTHRLI